MKFRIVVAALTISLAAGCVSEPTYQAEVSSSQSNLALANQYQKLSTQLQSEVAADNVKIQQLQDRVVVTLVDQILFASGSARLHAQGEAVLDKIVPTLTGLTGHWVEVQGYTDNEPIGPALRERYPTNWDLSVARATDVVRYLQSKGVPPVNLEASGFGEYQPVADNGTPAGRAQNRRIEIVLRSK
jgi:chemotaxis protein MotB